MSEFKIGKELAERVAKRLAMKCDLMFSHRDYCGTGLTWENGNYVYGKVWDGYLTDPMMTFDSEQKFIDWLAEQSDNSLRGNDEDSFHRNNQRLTQARLVDFVSVKPNPR
jgi:hypothetical protein